MQAWKANVTFHAYLDELVETSQGITLSKTARQLIAKYIDRALLAKDHEEQRIVNTALQAIPRINSAAVYKALFVRAYAGFEQYLRDLVQSAANTISDSRLVQSKLDPPKMKIVERLYGHQIQLAGEGFRKYFEPLDHIRINYAEVAKAIVQSSDKNEPFLLDGMIVGLRINNINRDVINKIFERFDCQIQWNNFSSKATLQTLLKTKGVRETDKATAKLLNDALARRNRLAHTSGSEELLENELSQHISFLRELSTFLFDTMSECVSAMTK